MFVKNISLTLVFLFTFVLASSAQNIRVIDNKGTLQIFNPWRLNGNGGITAPLAPAVYGTTPIGNLESFLGTTDAKSLVFGTNNIERFRISDLGMLGIGTATPANQLEIRQGTAGNSGLRFTNLTSASAATTSSSKVLSVNASGDVILTNVPGTQNIVDFSTATPNSGSPVFTPNTPADESVVYQSAVDNSLWTYNGTAYVTYTAPASTAWNLANTTNDAGSNKTSSIWRTGSIGIGTNNPQNNLDVVGGFNLRNTSGAAGSNYGIEFNTNSNAPRIDWVFNGGYIGQFASDANNFILQNSKLSTGGFRFMTNPGTGALDRLNILNNGNIGIGTASPANKLEITQGTAGNSGLRFTNLNSASTATTSSSKVLGLNSTGDVILTNVPGTQNIVDFSTATPTTSGVVFTPNTPLDESVVYQSSVDNSFWTYNGTTYVTYTPPASTAWFTAGTTNDAGNSKTSNIYRTGNVGIGTNNPATRLHIQGIQATLGANANAPMLRMSRPTWAGFKWGSVAQFNLGTYDDGVNPVNSKSRLDLVLADFNEGLSTTPTMTWLANGNVGINNTAPSAPLVVQGVSGTGSLKLIAPVVNSSGDNWWMGFGHGTTSNDANDRARIGVDILTGGAGRLFFTTGTSGSQTRAMFIDQNQRVGIGTSSPTSRLVVRGLNNPVSALGTDQTNAIFRVEGETNHALDMGTFSTSPWGSYIQSHNKASTGTLPLSINPVGGNVGIGTTNPRSTFEVNGSATNTAANNNGAANAIAFSLSNLAYTSLSAQSFNLTGMKDGGTYTLAVQGTTSGTSSFSGVNPSGTAFVFKSINNGTTIAGKDTLYTFVVMGTTVYVYMATGF